MKSILSRVISLIVIFGLWEIVGHFTDPMSFPRFSKVAVAIWDLITSGQFISALGVSLKGLLLGFLVAVLAGLSFGVFISYTRLIGRIIDVYVTILLAAPIAALIPVLIMAFGIGLLTKVTVIALMGFSVMAINTTYGLRSTDHTLLEMVHSFGGTPRQTFFKVVLPSALPLIMAGIRMGFAQCFVGTITAELLIVSEGLGQLLNQFGASFRAAPLFAMVLLTMLMGTVTIGLFQVLEAHLFKWKPKIIR